MCAQNPPWHQVLACGLVLGACQAPTHIAKSHIVDASDGTHGTDGTSRPTPYVCQCSNPQGLNYNGGRLIPDPNIIVIYWGSSIQAATQTELPRFYRDATQSVYSDWLSEYDEGAYAFDRDIKPIERVITITPNNGALSLSDDDVRNELLWQRTNGFIPTLNANSIIAIHMPPGMVVHHGDDQVQCTTSGGIIGYHDHFYDSLFLDETRYIVVTDGECVSPDPEVQLEYETSIASHELFETMTDGENDGWYWCGAGACEITDQCEDLQPASNKPVAINHAHPELPNRSYTMSAQFSNELHISQGGWAACTYGKTLSTLDLLFRSGSSVELVLGAPKGPWGTQSISSTIGSSWTYVSTGDFDGDGWSDVLWRDTSTGNVQMWLGPDFQTGFGPMAPEPGYLARTAGDVNDDGVSDIVWVGSDVNDVKIWMMNRDGTHSFVGKAGALGGGNLNYASMGDFNGDGIADLLFRRGSTMDMWVLKPDGTVTQRGTWTLASTSTIIGTADESADKKSDIEFYNTTSGTSVSIWYMDGTTRTMAAQFAGIPGATAMGAHDVTGDGVGDIVWRYTAIGTAPTIMVWKLTTTGSYDTISNVATVSLAWVFQGFGIFDDSFGS